MCPRHHLYCTCGQDECAMVAAFCSFWLLLEGNSSDFSDIRWSPSSFIHVVDQLPHSETIFSQYSVYIPSSIIVSYSLLTPGHFCSFFQLTLQNIRAFLVCMYILFRFHLSITSISYFGNIILPDFQGFSLIYYCIL